MPTSFLTAEQRRRYGCFPEKLSPDDLARLSPLTWRHINFLGRYDFSVPEPVARGELRPLQEPNSEYDF